jgi:hypothetical protein
MTVSSSQAGVTVSNTGRTRAAPPPQTTAGVQQQPSSVATQIAVGKPPQTAPVVAPPYANAELQALLHYRGVFIQRLSVMQRNRDPRHYDEVQKLAQTDAAIMSIVSQRAVDVLDRQGSPALVNQYMQHYYPGWTLRPRSDNTFHIEYQGTVSEPMSKQEVVSMLRYTGNQNYARSIDQAATGALAEQAKDNRKTQREILVEAVKGEAKLSVAQRNKMGITTDDQGTWYQTLDGQTYRVQLETLTGPDGEKYEDLTYIPVRPSGAVNLKDLLVD